MTSQTQSRSPNAYRLPLTTIGLGVAAIAGFTVGALAFRGDGDSTTPATEPTNLAASLPPSGGVADISAEEWAMIQRQVHDAFMDAYLATWPGGFPQALPVPPVGSTSDGSTTSPSIDDARAEHDMLIDGVLAGAPN